jgi:hypothetical protein
MRQTDLGALRTEALRRSKNIVKAELKSKGIRLSSFRLCDLNAMSQGVFRASSGGADLRSTGIAVLGSALCRTQTFCTKTLGHKRGEFVSEGSLSCLRFRLPKPFDEEAKVNP